ncbi:MAG: DUF21 domain-containing protein [Lentisphaeria bacterium]|nr:DUF21 domain-containing protein [Lentisphaeria bacterium]
MTTYFLLMMFFVCCQGFFSGMETGMVSVLRPRAEHEARNGSRRAKLLVYFLRRPGVMIATALIGVNISVVMASLMAKGLFKTLNLTGNTAMAVSSVLLSILMLCFEIVPKNWFRESAYTRCARFAPVFYGFYLLLWIPVRLFSAFTGALSRIVGKFSRNPEKEPNVVMREDFRLYLRDSQLSGAVDEDTATLLDRAIDVPGMLIRQILIPAGKVRSIPADMTVRHAFQFCQKHNLTKVPIRAPNGEWIAAFSIYDAIYTLDEEKWDVMPVSACAAKLYFINEDLRLGELLERLRFHRIPFLVVRDKNKKQTGIVLPEDLAALLFEN